MTDSGATRVAVYLDFDNIVISRYDQVNGRNSFQRDKAKGLDEDPGRLARATVDVGAIIDFASSFGTLVLTRAYADWSAEINAGYRGQLVGRAVDLVQLFPAAAYGKNGGADIRLAVDAVEDMFRLPDLTHVVIVAGDSDYIALAQRCKRLGRYVVGIGVAGSSSRMLAAACRRVRHLRRRLARHPGVRADPPGCRRQCREAAAEEALGTGEGRAAARDTRGARDRGAGDTRSPGRGDRAADPRAADRPGKKRRCRLAAQFRGEGADETHGSLVQRKKVARFQVFQRLPAIALRRRGAR